MASLHSFKNRDPTALRRVKIAIVRIKDLDSCSCPSAATFTSQFICNEPVLTITSSNCMTGNRNMILDIGTNLLNRLCLIQACQRNGIAEREVLRTGPVVAIGLIIVVGKIRNGVTLIILPRCQIHTTANSTTIIDNPRTIAGIVLICIYGHRNGGTATRTATRTAATTGLRRAKLPNLIVRIRSIFPRQSSTARIWRMGSGTGCG